jgi:hypothetical protein
LTSDNVRIRVKSGQSEAEVEADLSHIAEAIELIPEIISKFPVVERNPSQPVRAIPSAIAPSAVQSSASGLASSVPSVSIDRGDSLGDILSKFFADQWGKNPRKLSDVREALQSYGLSYPKQSVAVALLRLAKGSKIRRFKADGGEFVYTASTSLFVVAPPQPAQVEETPMADASAANV